MSGDAWRCRQAERVVGQRPMQASRGLARQGRNAVCVEERPGTWPEGDASSDLKDKAVAMFCARYRTDLAIQCRICLRLFPKDTLFEVQLSRARTVPLQRRCKGSDHSSSIPLLLPRILRTHKCIVTDNEVTALPMKFLHRTQVKFARHDGYIRRINVCPINPLPTSNQKRALREPLHVE